MTAPSPYVIPVHPDGMMTVTLVTPDGPLMVHAISCRYVPATVHVPQPHRVVAVEVIHDPNNPIPLQPYHCDPNLLARMVVPANALQSVRPYLP